MPIKTGDLLIGGECLLHTSHTNNSDQRGTLLPPTRLPDFRARQSSWLIIQFGVLTIIQTGPDTAHLFPRDGLGDDRGADFRLVHNRVNNVYVQHD